MLFSLEKFQKLQPKLHKHDNFNGKRETSYATEDCLECHGQHCGNVSVFGVILVRIFPHLDLYEHFLTSAMFLDQTKYYQPNSTITDKKIRSC